jgi:hypothetical protein
LAARPIDIAGYRRPLSRQPSRMPGTTDIAPWPDEITAQFKQRVLASIAPPRCRSGRMQLSRALARLSPPTLLSPGASPSETTSDVRRNLSATGSPHRRRAGRGSNIVPSLFRPSRSVPNSPGCHPECEGRCCIIPSQRAQEGFEHSPFASTKIPGSRTLSMPTATDRPVPHSLPSGAYRRDRGVGFHRQQCGAAVYA